MEDLEQQLLAERDRITAQLDEIALAKASKKNQHEELMTELDNIDAERAELLERLKHLDEHAGEINAILCPAPAVEQTEMDLTADKPEDKGDESEDAPAQVAKPAKVTSFFG